VKKTSATKYFEGVGRRKTSTARVRIYEGKGTSTINDLPIEKYFSTKVDVNQPLVISGLLEKSYFTAKVNGGGITGQLDAIKLGMSRAIVKMDADKKSALRSEGLITRDSRMVERKKYHHRKARKKPQFSKR